MRFTRSAMFTLLIACPPLFNVGCASLSPKLNVLPAVARHRAATQYQAARDAEHRGQLEKARELYAALQRQSPNTAEYAHRMGVVCTQLQDHITAGKYYEHARGLEPRNPALLADMGYSAYLQKDYPSAEALLSESVQLQSTDPRAINNLAMAIGFQGRYDESLACFRRVNPETQSLLNVAFIQSQRNEPKSAMSTYQQVLAHEPGNKLASTALQQLVTAHPELRNHPLDGNVAAVAKPTASSVTGWNGAATSQGAEVPPPALIVSGDEAPATAGDFVAPIITPDNGDWGSGPSSPQGTKVAAPINEPELTRPAIPPAELAVESSTEPPAARTTDAVRSDDVANAFDNDNAADAPNQDMDELTGLEWAQPELAARNAAANKSTDSIRSDDCLRGFCLVALRDERRLAPVSDEFTTEHQAVVYRFSSAAARDRFRENPEWYVPAAGGLDIIEVKRGHELAQGSLDFAVWFRHRLHMFSNAENLAAFRAAPRDFVASR
ncbi:MAG: hypothetical protein JSS49_02490 [Planctomycetes bacterium]|nr:hypothetical protein [Planctomycetota bacterium]